MKSILTSTGMVPGLFPLPVMSEPVPNMDSSALPMYVGRSSIYDMPVLLDLDALVNPHIAIVGATGSGKTYLLKSLIARFALGTGRRIVVIDWNGEYSDAVGAIGGTVAYAEQISMQEMDNGISRLLERHEILSVCFSGIGSEQARREVAGKVLQRVVSMMVGSKPGGRMSTMVAVDEAWKLARGGELQQLFRESRKYGFAMAIATQLTNDMSAEILANAACKFAFRLGGGENAAQLADSGFISGSDVLSRLEVGSCVVSMSMKNGGTLEFTVGHVDGFPLHENVIEIGSMNARISNQRFDSLVARLDGSERAKARLKELAASNTGTLHLSELTGIMVKAGFRRAEIVWFFRELGIDDASIAKACERASPVIIDIDESVK